MKKLYPWTSTSLIQRLTRCPYLNGRIGKGNGTISRLPSRDIYGRGIIPETPHVYKMSIRDTVYIMVNAQFCNISRI
jgi:hypothetical protein